MSWRTITRAFARRWPSGGASRNLLFDVPHDPHSLQRNRASRLAALPPVALALACVTAASPARGAPTPGPTGSLQNFHPAPAGDPFFGVATPDVVGHVVPRANLFFDFAYRPLTVQLDEGPNPPRLAVVAAQAFLHLNASLALWDRLLISANMPFAVVQTGESPSVNGVAFQSPSSAEVGDLRLGLRLRLVGESGDTFQLGLGGNVDVPTARAGGYAGEGAVSGSPQLHVGGRMPFFIWTLAIGPRLRAGERPHSFEIGAGGAAVLLKDRLQLGLEIAVQQPFKSAFTTAGTELTIAQPTSGEVLFGSKYRPLPALVVGLAAGPGLTHGWGTPVFRAVAMIGYEPGATRGPRDTDGDGIPDTADACPGTPGAASIDPKKNGCPVDSDGDGIPDVDDACPHMPGPARADPKKNGCLVAPDEGDAFTKACADASCVDGARRELVLSYVVRFPRTLSEMAALHDATTEPFAREVKALLAAHPEIARIEVEGHHDGGADEKGAEFLAEQRAKALREWLIARGVPAGKLVARTGPPSPPRQISTLEDQLGGPRMRLFAVTWPGAAK